MIAFVKGCLVRNQLEYIIVEAAGIGYRIFVPKTVAYQLPKVGEEILVYTHYYLREDGLALYGFLDEKELALFELLIGISGIGPKVAIGILGSVTGQQLVQAILQENLSFLIKLPGVGKKTGQRLIIELKDKLAKSWESSEVLPEMVNDLCCENMGEDAVLALVALGYQQKEARQAVNHVRKNNEQDDTEAIIKLALRHLMK